MLQRKELKTQLYGDDNGTVRAITIGIYTISSTCAIQNYIQAKVQT